MQKPRLQTYFSTINSLGCFRMNYWFLCHIKYVSYLLINWWLIVLIVHVKFLKDHFWQQFFFHKLYVICLIFWLYFSNISRISSLINTSLTTFWIKSPFHMATCNSLRKDLNKSQSYYISLLLLNHSWTFFTTQRRMNGH